MTFKKGEHCIQKHLHEYLHVPDQSWFSKSVFVTLIDKAYPENKALVGLNVEDGLRHKVLYFLSLIMFINGLHLNNIVRTWFLCCYCLVKKHSKFQNLNEIFDTGMIRLSNQNFDFFIQYQYTRTISRKKIMRRSLFEKHSKFLIFNKVFYCHGQTWHK